MFRWRLEYPGIHHKLTPQPESWLINSWGVSGLVVLVGSSYVADIVFSFIFLSFHRASRCLPPRTQPKIPSAQYLTHPVLLGTEKGFELNTNHPLALMFLGNILFSRHGCSGHVSLCHLFQPVFIDWVNNSLDYSSYSFPRGYVWQQAAYPSLTVLLIRRSMFPFLSKATKLPVTGTASPPLSWGEGTVIVCSAMLQPFCMLLIKSVINTLRGILFSRGWARLEHKFLMMVNKIREYLIVLPAWLWHFS